MLRLMARQASAASFGIDDVLIVLALVSCLNSKDQPFTRSPLADTHNEVIRVRKQHHSLGGRLFWLWQARYRVDSAESPEFCKGTIGPILLLA